MSLFNIAQATVLGAGLMGSGIAAHLAGAGIKVNLLDMVPSSLSDEDRKKGLTADSPAFRNKFAMAGKAKLSAPRAGILYAPGNADLITVGNFEDDLQVVKDSDWIIEVIVEELAPKQQLLKKVSALAGEHAIISTNTSGVPISKIASELPLEVRKRFLGTHFFNPVRQMKLLELIPCEETEQDVLDYMKKFGTDRLGKGVVIARDTPAFIANRIGEITVPSAFNLAEKFGFDQSRVDALTGRLIGRPMGEFALIDLVGLDITAHVCSNLHDSADTEAERDLFVLPAYYGEMVEAGILGNKVGKGFYMRDRATRQKLMRNLKDGTYAPAEAYSSEILEKAKSVKDLGRKINLVIDSDTEDGRYVWEHVKETLMYCAQVAPVITDDFRKIDLAMRWGYNWVMGPFELWDAIGAEKVIDRMKKDGCAVPEWVGWTLETNGGSFYSREKFEGLLTKTINLSDKDAYPEIFGTEEMSMRDLGDDVACIEFHSKGNAISDSIVTSMIRAMDKAERDFRGVVIGNQGRFFCGGAKLEGIYNLSVNRQWDEMLRQSMEFHDMTMRLKYAKIPVVSAAFGSAMGGGAETLLHSTKVIAHSELKMGLVEARLGLLPGGGGSKEMTVRASQLAEETGMRVLPLLSSYVKLLTGAVITDTAEKAVDAGYLRRNIDKIVMNDTGLIDAAKREVLYMAEDFRPAIKKPVRVLGTNGEAALGVDIFYMKEGNFISEYDAHVAEMIVWVMTGGGVSEGSYVSEEYLNKLEGEAFVELCHHPETVERIKAFLETGKFIRN